MATTANDKLSSTSSITVYALSEGHHDGNIAEVEINGKSVFGTASYFHDFAHRCMNVAVIDEVKGRALSVVRFDTSQ